MLTNHMRRWSVATALVFSLCATNGAFAASATSGTVETDEGTYIETMVVTGSRIPRAGFDTMLPATVLDSDFIAARGFTNVADAINEIPTFGTPGNSTQRTQGDLSVGQNFVNLFGLGSQRTLTLVNGRRFVSSNTPALISDADVVAAGPGSQVDLNMIPSSMIERVETIYVGGAPAYGADAIAGTVNIILKDDFEGLELTATYGEDTNSLDYSDELYSLLYGINFDNGRGNIVFGLEYSERDGLIESDTDHHADGWQFREPAEESEFSRVLVKNAHANIVSNNGVPTPGDSLLPNFGIGAMPNSGEYLQFSPDGSLQSYNVGTPTGNPVWSVGGDGLFLPDVVALFAPYDRTLVNSYMTYELTDNIELFGEFYWGQTNAREAANQPAYQSGFFGEESASVLFSIDHPLLTPAARDRFVAEGLDEFYLQRSSVDLRPDNNQVDSEQNLWRVVFGAQGNFELFERSFNWDFSYNRGQTDLDTSAPDIVSERFFYALDVVDVDPDGNPIAPACRVVADPSSRPDTAGDPFGIALPTDAFDDCVPLDLFGEGRASQEALDYITATGTASTELTQTVWQANLNFDLIELPGGALPIALGYENRTERGDFDAGGWLARGVGRGEPVNSISGEYETDEFYIEGIVPIFSPEMEIPFGYAASLEGAYRYVDNDIAGDDDIWTIGFRYSPFQDLEIRGNQTRSVRAPAITELFLPLSGTGSFASDPCDQRFVDEGESPEIRRANCIADGIDPDTFASNVVNASVQGFTGGNLDLENEEAEAWTLGAVFRPRWVENLTLAVDYYDFDIEDAIESFTLTQIMETCYDQSSFPNQFCDAFTRGPDGQLPPVNAFRSGFVNAGERILRGYSMDLQYSLGLDGVPVIGNRFDNPGTLDFAVVGWFPKADETTIGTSVDDSFDEPNQADIQLNWTTRYMRDNWSALWQIRYISSTDISSNDTSTSRDVRKISDQYFHNVGVTYDWNENLRLQVNVNNVFDNTPTKEAVAGGWDFVYDNIGRFVRATIQISL